MRGKLSQLCFVSRSERHAEGNAAFSFFSTQVVRSPATTAIYLLWSRHATQRDTGAYECSDAG